MSFREEFERVVRELEAHPRVEVYGAELAPPAPVEIVTEAISSVGIEPTQAMLDFYTAHNGAFLEWGIEGGEYNLIGGPGGWADYGTPPGVINILSVQDAFSRSWQLEYIINPTVGEETWNLAYGTDEPDTTPTAVVIDQFAIYYHTDLLLGPEPLLVVASDHGADLSCSDLMTFEQYLELVIARYGANPYDAVGIGWSRSARRLEEIERPSLDDLVSKAIEDESA
jgi:hypothetical protein